MTARQSPDIDLILQCARMIASNAGAPPIDATAAEVQVRTVLFGEKDVWGAFTEGLLTDQEVCNKLLAEITTWVYRTANLTTESTSWADHEVQAIMARALLAGAAGV